MRRIGRRTMIGAGALGLVGLGAAHVIGPGAEVTPGRSRARAINTESKPPPEAEVVIIGGGNLGASIAYYLAKRGVPVVLCEKGAIAGEASGRSVGHIHVLGIAAEELPVALAAQRLWRGVNAELQIDTGYRENGLLMQIDDEAERANWEKWLKAASPFGVSARLLSSAEASALAPVRKPWYGAIYAPDDGGADPPLVAPAFAEAAQRLGAKIVAPCAVRGLETAAGKVSAVITEHGAIKTSCAILAGGAWSTAFMENLGFRLPTVSAFQWCASFFADAAPTVNAIYDNTTWRHQSDGGITTALRNVNLPITPALFSYARDFMGTKRNFPVHLRLGQYSFNQFMTPRRWRLDEVSPFERRRILEPHINSMVVNRALKGMRENVPAFSTLRMGDAWGGVINTTPDMRAVLGPVAALPGLIMATGLATGLGFAPAIGGAIADIASGRKPELDLSAYAYERF